MSISSDIREQLLSAFRAELAEHVQTMTDGLLAIEQKRLAGVDRHELLQSIFRAAHSLKGAARAVGATAIEQLAHLLESILDAMRNDSIQLEPDLFTGCYRGLDAITAVQAVYEAGEITPPVEALQALSDLSRLRDQYMVKPGSLPAKEAPPVSDGSAPLAAPGAPKPVPDAAPEKEPSGGQNLHTALQQRMSETLSDSELPSFSPLSEENTPARSAGPSVHQELGKQNTLPAQLTQAGLAALQTDISAGERPSSGDETIRVSVSKLDALMAQLSELLVTKIRSEQRLAQVRQFQEMITAWQKDWLSTRSSYGRLVRQSSNVPGPGWNGTDALVTNNVVVRDTSSINHKDLMNLLDYAGASQDRLREMGMLINELAREYANDTMHMSLVIDELEEEVKRVRMLPVSTIATSFPRMIRDLARESGKEAILQIVGGETELDKRVLEQIKDPLMHILRNAVDHGIEPKEVRIERGKPVCGNIILKAEQVGKDVVISVSDDGGGLDLTAIRRSVSKHKGSETRSLSEGELVESIFQSGVSTRTIITGISGRGVGLDVVRRNVEMLQGRIDVDFQPNRGSEFRLTLPLRLTSTRGLLLKVSNQMFAVPLNTVERILLVSPQQITTLEGHDTVLYNGRPITLVYMEDVLSLPHTSGARRSRIPVVILAAAERRMAFAVDELAGEQEVVIKPLGKQLLRVGGISGATVLGSGEVVLILNVSDLIKLAMLGVRRSITTALDEAEASKDANVRQRILVVDDSITTRTLEKNILEAAGYIVQVATDGVEVLNVIASSGIPDLIISDVAMPRMNGFELTKRVKSDAHLSHIPVILVTSLESPEDKAKGIEVGADAYIVKGSFDQNNLLETIEQLI